MAGGPTVNRRQLGAELRRLREAARLTIQEAAKALGSSQPRMSRIETGKGGAVAKVADIHRLCELYGVTDQRQVDMLLSMLTVSHQPGWWEDFEGVLPSGLEVYVGLESDAQAERSWEPLLVHGLLQTENYARTTFLMGGNNRPDDIDALVTVRTERQKLLTRTGSPLQFRAIMDEAVIRRPLGGVSVMRDQLHHLAELTEMPNITIQVIPFNAGGNPGLGGPFSILEFEDDGPVVYLESLTMNLYLDKKLEVRRYVSTFDALRDMALSPSDSATLLSRAAEEMQ